MEDFFIVIMSVFAFALSIVGIVIVKDLEQDVKQSCYYCEHVDLQENGGYCLEGRHYILENGELKEIGECSAK